MDHLKKLSLYEVNAYYIKYLSQYQDYLFYSDGEKVQRKYVGIILEINGYDYFEPNRSPCER
jgi:protein AbiQ